MGQFKTTLHVHPDHNDRYSWVLDSELIYVDGVIVYTVPAGFTTNFASVPRIFWSIMPPYGKYTRAAVVHDFCYSSQGTVNKATADLLFHKILLESDVNKVTAKIMYMLVRLFGKKSWRSKH